MPDLSASFQSAYSESRKWVIVDTGRDPNNPPVLFSDYLEPGQSTSALTLYTADGIYGQVTYQRSDGAPTISSSITDGSVVTIE